MECEICGRDTEKLYEVNVDGANMLACEKCSRGRGTLSSVGTGTRARRGGAVAIPVEREIEKEELVENFGDVIRKAREKQGLPLKVLAEMINERESTLDRVEKQKALPEEKMRLKLEKELRIKLVVKTTEKRQQVPGAKKSEPVTLWDLAKKENEKGE